MGLGDLQVIFDKISFHLNNLRNLLKTTTSVVRSTCARSRNFSAVGSYSSGLSSDGPPRSRRLKLDGVFLLDGLKPLWLVFLIL